MRGKRKSEKERERRRDVRPSDKSLRKELYETGKNEIEITKNYFTGSESKANTRGNPRTFLYFCPRASPS